MQKIDRTGEVYGRLTVLKDTGTRRGKKLVWLCSCECGNTKEVLIDNLRNNSTKSCGCLNSELITKRRKKDLTGNTFGKLTVIKDVNKRTNGRVMWLCSCDCGNEVEAASSNLLNGHTKTCGCSRHDLKGVFSPRWKGGITPENVKIRRSPEYSWWREAVFKRDNYTCRRCGAHGVTFHAHHLNPFSKYEYIRFDLDNGVTLCKYCHTTLHVEFGKLPEDVNDQLTFIRT